MQLKATIEIKQKGNWFLARIPELDFVAQGRTKEEARENLLEVMQIQFKEMRELGTLEEYLEECGFIIQGDSIEPQDQIFRFENQLLKVA
jgi:predicted RNase H-like HicB family nuclease